jgi:hypothetical protein
VTKSICVRGHVCMFTLRFYKIEKCAGRVIVLLYKIENVL